MPSNALNVALVASRSSAWARTRERWAENARIFAEGRIGLVGVGLLAAVALLALVHPLLMATVWDPQIYDPIGGFTRDTPLPADPSWAHPLGLSRFGRDVLSQLMYSVRVAFGLGVLAAAISVSVGTLVGCLAAFYRDTIVDTFFMRLANFLMIFPTFTLLVALSGVAAIDLTRLAVIIGLLGGLGGITVVLKSRALGVTVKPFIDAARIAGGSDFHLIVRHVIPNVLPLSFLYMMFTVTSAIFAEAALSFFGLLPQVRMSLGLMINEAYTAGYLGGPLLARYWYLWVPPGLAITLLCAAFYLIGRGLDEVVNPRLREQR
jgi:peptide/nickel transport system permease protein